MGKISTRHKAMKRKDRLASKRNTMQAHLIVSGWRAVVPGGAFHEEYGYVFKDNRGWHHDPYRPTERMFTEFDNIRTLRLLGLYEKISKQWWTKSGLHLP